MMFSRHLRRHTRRAFLSATAGLLSVGIKTSNALAGDIIPKVGNSIRWLAFYGAAADEAVLGTYDIVVLDPAFQGSIDRVTSAGARVCSYLSLGEIRKADAFFAFLAPEALLPENPDWPGTHRVDVRDPSWRSLVLDRQIPALAAKGFTGIMFDTLDTPPFLEQQDPVRYRGMTQAAIELVGAIRERWPDLMIIMNRGYALLPSVVDKIDAVIAESLMTMPDPAASGGKWVEASQVELQITLLKPATRRRRPVPILSLDYWDPDDASTIAEIYRKERDLGHHPYVATRSLDKIVSVDR
jgi:uncharacterized protein (TIGR01370 family)